MLNVKRLRLNPAEIFTSDHLTHDLAGRTVRGGVNTMGAQTIVFALNMARTIVLARLLTPQDFGLIGMVTVVVGFATMFKDAGLSMATVQKESISHEQISALFWINVMISAALGVVLFVFSPLVAAFYGHPELTVVTAVLSLAFIIQGLTIQHAALLRRHMRFTALLLEQILAAAVSIIVAIALACFGWRYWALVVGTLASTITMLVLTYWFCPWMPGRLKIDASVQSMLKFGGHLAGFNLVNYFARNADNLLIGKFMGAAELGFYDRAYQILVFPIRMMSTPLSAVALPALCRLHGDRNRMHRYYLHLLYLLSLFAGPIVGSAFLGSKEIVLLLLGSEWEPASDVFRLLAIGGLLQPLLHTQSWLHLAVGRSDRVLRWSLIGTPIIVASFIIGMPWGIRGVAAAYSIAIILTTGGALSYAGQSVGLRFNRILAAVSRPISACVLAVGATALAVDRIGHFSSALDLLLKTGLFLALYGFFLLALYRGLKPVYDLKTIYNRMKERDLACQEEAMNSPLAEEICRENDE